MGLFTSAPLCATVCNRDIPNSERSLTDQHPGHRGCGPVGRFLTDSSRSLSFGEAVRRSDFLEKENAALLVRRVPEQEVIR